MRDEGHIHIYVPDLEQPDHGRCGCGRDGTPTTYDWWKTAITQAAALAEVRRDAEHKERKRLWFAHGCAPAGLYGDDGEMQCGHCRGDWKREPLEQLHARHQLQLAEARREIARLNAELADARGWLREHAKWDCGHISDGTGGEPEVCRICAVQDSEAEARRALAAAERVVRAYTGQHTNGRQDAIEKRESMKALAAALAAEPDGETQG